MELHVTPELEARIAQFAAQQGREPDELVQEALTEYFADELRFPPWMENWTDQDLQEAAAHIEEGLQQCEAGKLISSGQLVADLARMKDEWRKHRAPAG